MIPVVNITIVTFNRLDMTKLCVESIFQHTKYPFEVTVVDNGSKDETQKWLDMCSYPFKRVIKNSKNLGVAKASNIGWYLGPKDYYLKLDNDIVIQRDNWLTQLVEIYNKIPQAGCVAYNVEIYKYKIKEINRIKVQQKDEGNVGGCCCLVPKKTWEKLGYWCEDYGVYGEEDADYGYKIKLSGLLNLYHNSTNTVIHLPHQKYPNIKPNEKWYSELKKQQRQIDLQTNSKYYKNMGSYPNKLNGLRVDL